MTPQTFKTKLKLARSHSLKPRSTRTITDWAMSERVLSAQSSSIPGPWKPLFPGSVEVLNSITRPGVRSVSLMFSAQLAKSDILLNTLGYSLSENPTSVILAQPSEKMAEDFSRTRIAGLINDCKVLKTNLSQTEDGLFLKKFKTGGRVNIVSAAAPSDLASRSAKIILLDEIDRYTNLSKEGDPEQLLTARASTFYDSVVVAVSTPTNAGTSRIERRFLAGSQHKWHGLCPHCHQFEFLAWPQVFYEPDAPETAHYVCSKCDAKWTEADRVKANQSGKFIADNPEETTNLSFYANCIASPFKPLTHFAGLFHEAKKDPESLRSFVNLYLAETWKPKVDVPDHKRLFERRERFPIGIVPAGTAFITMGVDVQANWLEAQIVAWNNKKESFIFDHRQIIGPTHTQEPWNELEKLINSTFKTSSGRELQIQLTCIDSGFNTQNVYEFVSKFNPNKVRAVKGSDSSLVPYKMGTDLTLNSDGSKRKFGHKLWVVGSSLLKEKTYSLLKLDAATDGQNFPEGYIHIPQFDEEFFQSLTSEALTKSKSGRYEWVKHFTRNEKLDTHVYARAAALMYGLDRFNTNDWAYLAGEDAPASAIATPKIIPQPQAPPLNPKRQAFQNVQRPKRRF